MLPASLPQTTLAHKRCGPIPLTALPLTPPADAIATSATVPPVSRQNVTSRWRHPTKKRQKSLRSQFLLKIREKVIFAHFHSFFPWNWCMQTTSIVTARAYSPPPSQQSSNVLLSSSSCNLQITQFTFKVKYLPQFSPEPCKFQFSSVNFAQGAKFKLNSACCLHTNIPRTALLPVFPTRSWPPVKKTINKHGSPCGLEHCSPQCAA